MFKLIVYLIIIVSGVIAVRRFIDETGFSPQIAAFVLVMALLCLFFDGKRC